MECGDVDRMRETPCKKICTDVLQENGTLGDQLFFEFYAWGLDKGGVAHGFVRCFLDFKEDLHILDIQQLRIGHICCFYTFVSISERMAMGFVKAFLLAGAIVHFQVDYKYRTDYRRCEKPNNIFTEGFPTAIMRDDFRSCEMEGSEADNIMLVANIIQTAAILPPQFLMSILDELNKRNTTIFSISQEEANLKCGGVIQIIEIKLSFPELNVSTQNACIWDLEWMRELYMKLQDICWENNAEIVVRKDDLLYRPKEKTLVVMGLNETIIEQEMIDEFLLVIGLDPKDFESPHEDSQQIFKRKIQQLAGQSEDIISAVLSRLTLTEGAMVVCNSFKRIGYKMALITQGFDFASTYFGRALGFDYILSNHLEVIDGKLTGHIIGESIGVDTAHMMDPLRKVDWLHLLRDKEGISRENVIVIGDYRNVNFLYESCGFRIFFKACIHKDLRIALYMSGFNRKEVHQFEEKFISSEDISWKDSSTANVHRRQPNKSDSSPPKEPHCTASITNLQKVTVFVYGEMQHDALSRLIKSTATSNFVGMKSLKQLSIRSNWVFGATLYFISNTPTTGVSAARDEIERLSALKEFVYESKVLKLKVNFHVDGDATPYLSEPEPSNYLGQNDYVLVLMQHPEIPIEVLYSVLDLLTSNGIDIISFEKLSVSQFCAVQVHFCLPKSSVISEDLKLRLLKCAAEHGADIALQKNDIQRFCRRLVVFDMDSTLIQQEVIDEIGKVIGKSEQIVSITSKAMNGGMDFTRSLMERVALFNGIDSVSAINAVQDAIELTPGALRLCKTLDRLGYKLAVVSGGFIPFARKVKKLLGLHHSFANSLEIDHQGKFTGKTLGPIVTPERKASLLRMLADVYECSVEQVIAIGDGANDIPMLLQAGMSVAFCAKQKVKATADFQLNTRDLSNVLYLLGISDDHYNCWLAPAKQADLV